MTVSLVPPSDNVERPRATIWIQLHVTQRMIDALIVSGYLKWPQRADRLAISKAIHAVIRDAPEKRCR